MLPVPEVWAVDEAGGVAAEEGAGGGFAIAEAFVEEAEGGVLLLGGGALGAGAGGAAVEWTLVPKDWVARRRRPARSHS